MAFAEVDEGDTATKMFQGLGWPPGKQEPPVSIKKSIYVLKMKADIGFLSKGMGCAIKLLQSQNTSSRERCFILTSGKAVSQAELQINGRSFKAERYSSKKDHHRIENLSIQRNTEDFVLLPLTTKPKYLLTCDQSSLETRSVPGKPLLAFTFINEKFVQVKFEYNTSTNSYEPKGVIPAEMENELSTDRLVGAPVVVEGDPASLVVGVLAHFESEKFRPVLFSNSTFVQNDHPPSLPIRRTHPAQQTSESPKTTEQTVNDNSEQAFGSSLSISVDIASTVPDRTPSETSSTTTQTTSPNFQSLSPGHGNQVQLSNDLHQETMDRIALAYLKKFPDPHKFKSYLESMDLLITGQKAGSLVITVQCKTVRALDKLWEEYTSGHLNEMAEKYLITPELLKEFGFVEIKLKTHISLEEYEVYRRELLAKGEMASYKLFDVSLADRKMSDGFNEKPLYILLLCSEWGSSKGGRSTFNRQLAIHLAKQPKLKVHCYLPEVSEIDKRNAAEVDVHLIEASFVPGEMDPLLKLRKLSPEILSPDVVISHGRKFGTAAFFLKKDFPSCKWVHFVHVDCEEMGKYKVGHDPVAENNDKDKKEEELAKAADLVIAVGLQLGEKYSRSLYTAAKKVEIFYPGLSTEFLHLPQTSRDPKEFHVYTFGRMAEEDFWLKGFDVAANAVGKLGMNYRLYAVCAPHNEVEKTRHFFLGKTSITNDQLYVHEYCNDREQLKEMMCMASVVVMPSRTEAFGLIGLEALSAGVPVLVSAKSGFGIALEELLFDSGCVVEGHSPDVWAEKIELLSSKERSKRNENIEFVRTQYGDRYKWDDQCSRLVQQFLRLRSHYTG